jgi:iron complex outermembrane recepter protein
LQHSNFWSAANPEKNGNFPIFLSEEAMKSIWAICTILMFLIPFYLEAENAGSLKGSLSGKITDKKTGDALPGVNIYFPDLKTGTTTGTDGSYKIDNLPQAKVTIQLSYISYRTVLASIDLSSVTVMNFEMEYAATELNEVVVTGLSKSTEQKRNPTPMTILPKMTLLQNSSTNIIDAISTQPGISQITTGSGISKPVIRGLGYNRVVVVKDGIRQEGQQWGDEHGIEIDEFSVNRVEILKGPASLTYGSDAMAGVINMLPAPSLPQGQIRGNLMLNYQTNNGLACASGNLAGNNHGMVYDFRYSYKTAHAYRNRYDGYVYNSGFQENAISLMTGLIKSWGYTNLDLSVYNLTPGIIEGERDSTTGQFLHPVKVNDTTESQQIALDKELKSYSTNTPNQKIHHYKAVLNSSFVLGKSTLKTIAGFQQNRRQEYADILNPDQYGLYLMLNTANVDIRYLLPEIRKYSVSLGISGMGQRSENKGVEFLIPDYHLFDAGGYILVKKPVGNFDFSGGIRYDTRIEHVKDLYINAMGERVPGPEPGAQQRFSAFNTTFSGISGSMGATWQISKAFFTKFNVSRGYRSPNIAELGSNGVHEGTLRYELGNPDLKAEYSLQFDYTLGLSSEHISAELDIFDNTVNNYIFSRKLTGFGGGDSLSEGLPTYQFVSGNAHLSGGEVRIDIHPHPLDWIHFENTFSFVQASQYGQPDSTGYLPLIPPPKWQSSLRFSFHRTGKMFQNPYFQIESEWYFDQDRYYSAYGTETRTPGYILFNVSLGTDITWNQKPVCSLYVNLSNIMDAAYQSHLSRLKYAPENYATGRTGIYNMGRNIGFKLFFPVNIR